MGGAYESLQDVGWGPKGRGLDGRGLGAFIREDCQESTPTCPLDMCVPHPPCVQPGEPEDWRTLLEERTRFPQNQHLADSADSEHGSNRSISLPRGQALQRGRQSC